MAPQSAAEKEKTGRDGSHASTQNGGATLDDMLDRIHKYAEESPEKFALTCLGIGFILGWKLKPW